MDLFFSIVNIVNIVNITAGKFVWPTNWHLKKTFSILPILSTLPTSHRHFFFSIVNIVNIVNITADKFLGPTN